MARKNPSRGTDAASAADNLGQSIADSAQRIWLAGLGAFSRAKTEGDRMFETLVEQGRTLNERARDTAGEAWKSVRGQTGAAMGEAQGRWDRLEQVFEERVARSLRRLGVLTRADVEELTRQVQELNVSVRSLATARKPRPAGAGRAAAGRKAKSGARRKAARKAAR